MNLALKKTEECNKHSERAFFQKFDRSLSELLLRRWRALTRVIRSKNWIRYLSLRCTPPKLQRNGLNSYDP